MRKRTTAVSLCAALLCALLLSGCGMLLPIRAPTSLGQKEQAPPPAQTKRLYSLRMGDAWGVQGEYTILDEDGQVVLQGQGLSILYDCATGLPQCILARRYEAERSSILEGHGSYQEVSALYDTEGNLLEDWHEASYGQGLGPYILRWFVGDYELGGGGWTGYLYNIYTKEKICEGISYLSEVGNGQWGAMDGAGMLMGILDAEANAVTGFPMQQNFGYTYAWKDRYVTSLREWPTDIDVVVDKDFNELYRAKENSFLVPMGDWLAERGWNEGTRRVLNRDFEEVYSAPENWEIDYYDGDVMIRYNYADDRGTIFCDGADNEILGGCEWITPGCELEAYDAQQFLAYKDGTLYMLDGEGNELARKEGDYSSGEYIGPGRYVLSSPGGFNDECVLVDENLEPLSDAYGFFYNSYHHYTQQAADGYLEAGWYTANYKRNKINALDMDGNILLADLTELQESGPDRLVVVWGFSCGLVDAKGNWLYKTSAFGLLEDE